MMNFPETTPDKNIWIKSLAMNGHLRGVGVQATTLINSMVKMHGLEGDPKSAKMLGEATIGALLIASYCKPGEKVNLNVRGSGHVYQALVDAHPDGRVRGYVVPSAAPTLADQSPGGPWGEGLLSVLRTKLESGDQGKARPYVGTVPLLTGHLAKDLTFYWVQSEQVPSAVGLAVNVSESGQVTSAAGFLIQALPGATTEEVALLETNLQNIASYDQKVAEDANPMELLSYLFQDTSFLLLEEKELSLTCECSLERVERALLLTGPQELEALLKEQGKAEVLCEFCNKNYVLSRQAIEDLLKRNPGVK